MDTHVAAGTSLTLIRFIPAPPEAVFAAWIEPEKVKAWFGPYGMTTPVAEIEPRAGGRHYTLMRDAEGKEYPNPMVIEQMLPGKRLVLRVPEGSSCPLPGAVGTLDFLPHGLGTRFEVRWDHPSAEMRAMHQEMGFDQGWGETVDKLGAFAATPATMCGGPSSGPTKEHGWLHRILGDWTYEHEANMPDGSTHKATGTESVRALGPYWIIGEGQGEMPGGGTATWTVTVGYDNARKRFRGSWCGSMMPSMFFYDGALGEDGLTLPLESEGPAFDGSGMATFRDTVTMTDQDTRTLTAEVRDPDGRWTRFMHGTYRRVL